MKGSNVSVSRTVRTWLLANRSPQWRAASVVPTVALVALLASCGGKIPPTFYYQLNLQEPAASNTAVGSATALIMPFKASEMLMQSRIVYRPSPEEVGYYEYHRWAEDPRTTVTKSFQGQLRRRGTFRQVVGFDARAKADYLIRGRIERLEEVDYGGGVTVRAKLTLDLLELPTRKTVWQGASETSQSVSVGDVRSVVTQMSGAVQSAIEKLASDLDAFVRSGAAARTSSGDNTQAGQ